MNTNRVTRKRALQKQKSAEKLFAKCEKKDPAVAASIGKKKKRKLKVKKHSAETASLKLPINSKMSNNINVVGIEIFPEESDADNNNAIETQEQIHNEYPSASPPIQDDLEFQFQEFHEEHDDDDRQLLSSPPRQTLRDQHSTEDDLSASPVDTQKTRERHGNDDPGNLKMHHNFDAEDFIENTWKMEVKKDISALFKQNGNLVKTVMEIKRLLREKNTRRSRSSSYSTSDEEIKFAMLPEFKMKKVWQVREMEVNINEDRIYKRQLVRCI